jgi:hypothetical protein
VLALDDAVPAPGVATVDLLALDEALTELHAFDSRLGRLVEMKDFAIVARLTPAAIFHKKPFVLLGIAPGQERTQATRFCVSGPFPSGMTIEKIIDGVVVRFRRVQPHILSSELGVWENTTNRPIPLYPD